MATIKKPVPEGWEDVIRDYQRVLACAGRRVETINLRSAWLRAFARAVDCAPWSVESASLIDWSGSQSWSPETRRSVHQTLTGFYRWGYESGFIEAIPVIPKVKRGIPAPHPVSPMGIVRAQRCEDERVALMVTLAARLGMRRGEVARAHTSDLIDDLAGTSLIVHGKGGKQRIIPLPSDIADAVRGLPEGFFFPGNDHGHLSPKWVGKLVKRALPHGDTMHGLRHSFATKAYRATHNLVDIQEALGHASLDTTRRSIAASSDTLREVVEAVAD